MSLKWLLAVGVISIMGLLSALFSGANASAGAPEKLMAEVYKVDLSGNQMIFQIPENYSRELLTSPITPSVDLFAQMEQPSNQLVAQRWWDFDKKKFFGKDNLGHLVMTVQIRRQAKGETADFFLREQLITYIYMDLLRQHQDKAEYEWKYGKPDNAIAASSDSGDYKTKIINNNNWLFYILVGPEMVGVYVLPITSASYLEFTFTRFFSPNLARSDWNQVYDPAQILEDGIMNRVLIQYAEGKPIGQLTQATSEPSNEPLILPPFIRPEGYKVFWSTKTGHFLLRIFKVNWRDTAISRV